MAQHSAWKKALLTTLVFSMISGGAAFADELEADDIQSSAGQITDSSAAAEPIIVRPSTPFTDVKNGHWAEKHIAKLNLQGIVQGYQGKFRPADNVTQQEAVVMALRFMGLADQVNTLDNQAIFPDAFVVGDAYKAYVVAAFQHNLLDQDEEFADAEADPSAEWGKRQATREWITKLAVRAIGQQKLALEMSNDRAAFRDAGEIGEQFAGYVNAATTLELVKGVTPDKFEPKGLINRAQLATLFSRAESQHNVTYKGQSAGIITQLDDSTITLFLDTGRSTSYAITPETLLYRFDSEQATQLSQLAPYTNATIITAGGNALYIEQQSDDKQVETVEGTFESVDADNGEFFIKVGNRFVTIPFDSTVVVVDGAGQATSLADLAAGSSIAVLRETFREDKLAVKVEVKGAPVNKTGTGTVVGIAGGKMTVTDATDGEKTWSISAAAVVQKLGAAATLGDVKAGDTVTYKIENDLVTSIAVDQSAISTVTGNFDAVGADLRSMTYTVNGKLEANFLALAAKLEIPGIDNPTWKDLVKEDVLEITLNGKGEITSVKVTNRQVETVNGATVRAYDESSKTLLLTDDKGKAIGLTLTDKTRIEMGGNQVTLAGASGMFVKNRKLSVTHSEGTAVSIRFFHKYSGTLMVLNTTSNQVTLKLADGSNITLPYTTPSIDIFGKATAALADVKSGDTVTLLLDQNQERAVAIQVHQTVQHKIIAVDAGLRKVKLMTAAGAVTEYHIGTDVTYADEFGAALKLEQLTAGQYANVTFAGKQPAAFKRVIVTYGRAETVSASLIKVKDFNGKSHEIALGSNYEVTKNGAASNIASLTAGDRVEVRKDESGKVLVSVFTAEKKIFSSYDTVTRKLATIGGGTYTLSADALVTSGDAIIAMSSLKSSDLVTIYQRDGIVVEVAKQ